jgi:hypothetical protein
MGAGAQVGIGEVSRFAMALLRRRLVDRWIFSCAYARRLECPDSSTAFASSFIKSGTEILRSAGTAAATGYAVGTLTTGWGDGISSSSSRENGVILSVFRLDSTISGAYFFSGW